MYTKIISKILILAIAGLSTMLAVSCVDDSAPTNTTPTDATPPAVVTLNSEVVGEGRVALTWTDPADADFAHVLIRWTPEGGTTAQPLQINKGVQRATIEGLDAATPYTFSATSVDTNGIESASSAPVSVTPDVTPPADVTLSASAIANGQVELTWTDPADADFSYVLIRWTPADGTPTQPLRINKGTQMATIEGLDVAIRYTFSATSVDTNGIESAGGASASVSVTPDATAPAPVTDLAGAVSAGGEVTLTWRDPADADFSHVSITWRPTGVAPAPLGAPAQPLEVAEGTERTTITGLDATTEYAFSVASVDDNDVKSASVTESITPDNTPPADVTLSASVHGDGQVRLSWNNPNDPDFSHIVITWTPVDGAPAQPFEIGNFRHTTIISGLDSATEYTFRATSVDDNDNVSDGSDPVSIIPDPTPPANVTLRTNVLGDGEVELLWENPLDDDFSHISITWAPTGGTPAQPLEPMSNMQRTTITGLAATTRYTFRATSVDTNGNVSDGSDPVSVIPDPTPPADVTSLSASADAYGEVELTWTDPAGDNSFAHVLISWSTDGGMTTQSLQVNAGAERAIIESLAAATEYTFSVTSVDTNRNQSDGVSVSTTTDDHGNAQVTATTIGAVSATPSTVTGNIEYAGDVDYFRVTVTGKVHIQAQTTGSTDTVGSIYLSGGTSAAAINESSGAGKNFKVAYTNIGDGTNTYYIAVEAYHSVSLARLTGAYTLSVSTIADDHGNTQAAATALITGTATTTMAMPATAEIEGDIEAGGDVDYFSVTTSGAGTIRAYTTGDSNSVGAMYLSGSTTPISSDNNSGADDNFDLSRTFTVQGTYYIRVSNSFTAVGTGAYTLHVSFTPTAPADDHGNAQATATAITIGTPEDGNIESHNDVDYFAVTTTGAGFIRAYTTGSTNTFGRIYLSGETTAVASNGFDGEVNFDITYAVSGATTYYIEVSSFPAATGEYALNVVFTTDHGNTQADATAIESGVATSGRVQTLSDVDYFSITIPSHGKLALQTTGSANTRLILHFPDGSTASGSGSFTRLNLDAGSYYISVGSHSLSTGDYVLTVTFTATP